MSYAIAISVTFTFMLGAWLITFLIFCIGTEEPIWDIFGTLCR